MKHNIIIQEEKINYESYEINQVYETRTRR